MIKAYLEAVAKPGQKVNPLFNYMDVEVETISKEKAVLRLKLKRDFLQGGGVVAGGIMATLADEAMAHVILANLPEMRSTATIEMNVRYLKPIVKGELIAEARVIKQGKNVVTVSCDVSSSDGDLVAKAGASFMIIDIKGAKK